MPLSAGLTLQDWRLAAVAAGLDPAPYAPRRTWIKDEPDAKQVTVALSAPGLPGWWPSSSFSPMTRRISWRWWAHRTVPLGPGGAPLRPRAADSGP